MQQGDNDPPEDDADLFRSEMAGVTPLTTHNRSSERKPLVDTPGLQQRRAAAQDQLDQGVDPNFLTLGEVKQRQPLEVVEWKQNGVQNAVFDKLRRGGYSAEVSVDLHRLTVKEARAAVFTLVQRMLHENQRCAVVAHGKGEFSETPARLKSYVAHWLEQHPDVIAFCSAQRSHGGVGAMYVLVRKSHKSSAINRERFGLRSEDHDDSHK